MLSAASKPSQENDMFEFETSMSRPSAHELHMRARREQARVVNAFLSDTVAKFIQWTGILAGNAMMLAQRLVAEWRLRRDIRTLQQFHDRELTDMGLGRGEIERVVRYGRRPQAASRSPYPLAARRSPPPDRLARIRAESAALTGGDSGNRGRPLRHGDGTPWF
jgi:uncharacterized protein YjiS (DUF1127 family)